MVKTMARTIEELTIQELQALLKLKLKVRKQAPKLRAERKKLAQRLAEIDGELAMLGAPVAAAAPRLGRPKKSAAKAARKAVKKAARKAPKKAAAPKAKRAKAVKRHPRGAVQIAIAKVLGDKTMAPSQIAREVVSLLKGGNPKSILVCLDNLRKRGRVLRVAPAQYRMA
jgi:hypothetical protein